MTRSVQIVERMRWMTALAGAAVLALLSGLVLGGATGQLRTDLGGSSSASALASGGSTAPLDPRIATLAHLHPGRTVQVIVQFDAAVAEAQARVDAAQVHGRVIGQLPIIHGLALELSAAQARALSASPDVHAVSLNTTVRTESFTPGFRVPMMPGSEAVSSDQLQTTYAQTLGVTPLWRFGVTGTGVGVAVIDTGVDGALPDFASSDDSHSRVIVSAVDNAHAKTAADGYGHGTDVAGIIAGNGDNRPASDPLRGQYVGVAPNANLISIKVSDEKGATTVLNVLYGLQFAIQHQADYNIRVVNLSMDAATPESYKNDPLDAGVEAAWMHGIVVVVAAGNRGGDGGAVEYAPANDPYVITVGGLDEHGTADPGDDTIAPWSSRGATQDGLQKPDVYAPGAHIVSVLAPNSMFATACATCVIGGGQYIRTSGTSMAAPAVAGLVADLLQLHPQWTPDQVKGALTSAGASENASVQEPNAIKVALDWNPPLADQGLTPSNLLDVVTGTVTPTRGSWGLGSWGTATGALAASYATASWACDNCRAKGAGINSNLGSWGLGSWGTASLG